MSERSHDKDVAFIQALAELLRDNDLTELRVKRDYGEEDSLDVRVSRMGPPLMETPRAVPAPIAAVPAEPSPASAEPAPDPGVVASPMVGTVYLSPEPGAASFVGIGDQVSEGDTLMIVEAMKTMNHIPAPRAGKVTKILVEDGAPVEYGAPLVVLS